MYYKKVMAQKYTGTYQVEPAVEELVDEQPMSYTQNSQKMCYFDASQLKKYTC